MKQKCDNCGATRKLEKASGGSIGDPVEFRKYWNIKLTGKKCPKHKWNNSA